MSSPFRRSLPARPRPRAAEEAGEGAAGAFTAGDAEARARIRAALPDKQRITLADAQFVLAREYGFANWAELKQHIDATRRSDAPARRAHARAHSTGATPARCDASSQQSRRAPRSGSTSPSSPSTRPPIVAYANDPAMVDVLLEFGADPNRRSEWWAGGFHALHSRDRRRRRTIARRRRGSRCVRGGASRSRRPARAMIARGPGPRARARRRRPNAAPLRAVARRRRSAARRRRRHRRARRGSSLDAGGVDARSQRTGAGRYDARAISRRARRIGTDIFLAAALGLDRHGARDARGESRRCSTCAPGRATTANSRRAAITSTSGRSAPACSPLDVAAQFEQRDTLRTMLEFASPLQRLYLACRLHDEEQARSVLRGASWQSSGPWRRRIIGQ